MIWAGMSHTYIHTCVGVCVFVSVFVCVFLFRIANVIHGGRDDVKIEGANFKWNTVFL